MNGSGLIGAVLAAAGVATPFFILWRRRRALADRIRANREPTEVERAALRRRGRQSIAAFVLFWVVSLSLVLAVSFLRAQETGQLAVLALILLLVVLAIAFHLSTRCPICQYRLGYQRALGVPRRCERCGANL